MISDMLTTDDEEISSVICAICCKHMDKFFVFILPTVNRSIWQFIAPARLIALAGKNSSWGKTNIKTNQVTIWWKIHLLCLHQCVIGRKKQLMWSFHEWGSELNLPRFMTTGRRKWILRNAIHKTLINNVSLFFEATGCRLQYNFIRQV